MPHTVLEADLSASARLVATIVPDMTNGVDPTATLEAATTHLNTRRDTALRAGAAAKASLEKALVDCEIFGAIGGDILTNDLAGLAAVRQIITSAHSDLTVIFDRVVADKAEADAAS